MRPWAVDKVLRGPILIVIGAPNGVIIVRDDGIVDGEILNGLVDITEVFFIGKVRRMDADDDNALVFVFFCPCFD